MQPTEKTADASRRPLPTLRERLLDLLDAIRDSLAPACEYEPIPIPVRSRRDGARIRYTRD